MLLTLSSSLGCVKLSVKVIKLPLMFQIYNVSLYSIEETAQLMAALWIMNSEYQGHNQFIV